MFVCIMIIVEINNKVLVICFLPLPHAYEDVTLNIVYHFYERNERLGYSWESLAKGSQKMSI